MIITITAFPRHHPNWLYSYYMRHFSVIIHTARNLMVKYLIF